MLNLFALVKPVVFTYANTPENIAKLEERGVTFSETPNGLVVKDSNGKPSILLNTLAGQSVSRSVISGSIAAGEGFEVGNVYVMNTQEKKANEYGRQFSFVNCGKVDPWKVAEASASMGEKDIIDVSKSANADTGGEVIEKEEKKVAEF